MTVTYKYYEYGEMKLRFPVLHRVKYADTLDGIISLYQRSYKDYLVDEWLKKNCRGKYYHSPGYTTEKYIEFEDDQDAVWFALRWS